MYKRSDTLALPISWSVIEMAKRKVTKPYVDRNGGKEIRENLRRSYILATDVREFAFVLSRMLA